MTSTFSKQYRDQIHETIIRLRCNAEILETWLSAFDDVKEEDREDIKPFINQRLDRITAIVKEARVA